MANRMLTPWVIAVAAVAAMSSVGGTQTPSSAVPTAAGEAGGRQVASVFARTISLRLERVTLKQAIDVIAAEGRVRIAYSRTLVPLDQIVSLMVDSITVGEALTVLLRGTGIAVEVAPGGSLMLDRAGAASAHETVVVHEQRRSGGTISGTVVDSITGATVPYVALRVEETGQSVTASAQGRYTIPDVAPGEYRVTARRVGFIARTRPVVVEEGKVATLDFKLNRPPTKLDEVVTTALGDQRRYEVGNSIATINVDSLVPTAPITSITDILSARVPGLQVRETGGLVGSGQAIRIRGQSSLVLAGDPIIIVDGVRTDNTPGGNYSTILGPVPSPSRINDLDFSQIATIDVLRGPAATTEYGTDAANGVIVIKTKRGTAGPPQWNASIEQGASVMPQRFPEYYYAWGHLTDGTNAPVDCPLVPIGAGRYASSGPPYTTAVTFGTCAQDSVTHFNPLNDPATTMYGTGTRNRENVSVGGGSETLRYHLGAGLSNEVGMIRLPEVFRAAARSAGFPSSALKPNALDQRSINANIGIRLGQAADLAITTGYQSTFQSAPGGGNLSDPFVRGVQPILDDSAHYYGYSPPGDRTNTPLTQLGRQSNQQTNRLTAGMTVTWHPASWLTVSGDVGIDHGTQAMQQTILPQIGIYGSGQDSAGQLAVTQVTNDIYSADARASATLPVSHWLRFVTSVGTNYADTRQAGLFASAVNVSTANQTLNGSASPYVTQDANRNSSLGGYVDEQLVIADRLFIDGAARVDAGSGYGDAYRVSVNPKANVSYIALSTPSTVLRLRGALGIAGQQPPNGASLLLYNWSTTGWLHGGPVSTVQLGSVGNPLLQPERSREFEGGADIELFGGRVSAEVSAYQKHTDHALVSTSLGFDLNQLSYVENIGAVRNSGVEAALSAMVVQSWAITWSVSVNGAINRNKLLKLDPGFQQQLVTSYERQAAGYPLYGYWGQRITYADRNRDGIIEPSEITVTDSASFLGSSLPTQTGALTTHVGLFGSALALGSSFDYAGGYRVFNYNAWWMGYAGIYLPEQNIRGQPLWLQARAFSFGATAGPPCECSSFFEDGSFLRFRELSLTYTVPARWVRRARLATVSVTGAVRNLALWTRYKGPDPEVSDPSGGNPIFGSQNGGNNDIRQSGARAVPLPRQWFVRFNLGF